MTVVQIVFPPRCHNFQLMSWITLYRLTQIRVMISKESLIVWSIREHFLNFKKALLKTSALDSPAWMALFDHGPGPVAPLEVSAQALAWLFFTSGTTGLPKRVGHTAFSYPVGHLSTAVMAGIRTDDIHHNLSAPGWAKWAWSSFFAPLNVWEYLQPKNHIVHGYPRREIAATTTSLDTDVIVMGTVSRLGVPGYIMGDTAEETIHQLKCAVVGVKPRGFESPISRD